MKVQAMGQARAPVTDQEMVLEMVPVTVLGLVLGMDREMGRG